MDNSGGSVQEKQGMIDDGFSSDEELYMKKDLDTEEDKKKQIQEKVKQQIKYILPPPQEIKSKQYSLLPDKVNGWGLKVESPNPIPIIFGNRYIDNLITLMLNNPNKRYEVVYLGPRYQNTFYAWRDKPFKFPYGHLNLPKNIKYKKRPFLGQNPQVQDSIYFDSILQSGNLDVAIQVNSHEYDLFLRVDSNTRGHFNWFNFTIKNIKPHERYKLNICNLERGFCLYSRGMKPYIKSLKKKGEIWRQAGQNVSYGKKQVRFARDYNVEQKKLFSLSFQIQTDEQDDQIQISYCVPYTFSQMLQVLEDLKLSTSKKNFLKETNLCMSLGGLPIPMLSITQPQKQESKILQKKCIIICGRVHPGESNGSFMMEGFLKFICGQTKSAHNLRKNIIFKIVPMMNPDGVVLGNYRTGLSGKDFNRQYRNPDKDIFPQVYFFKKLVTQTKIAFKNNLFMFLDLHGHSQKKNVFAYGPQFPIAQRFYYQSRIFAKILEKQNRMFRYHSCIFKISECKLSTARAILLKKMNIPLTYTIQASNGFYHDTQLLISVPFLADQWVKMGQSIGRAINEYVDCLLSTQRIKIQREKAKIQAVRSKNQRTKIKSNSLSPVKKHSQFNLLSAKQDAKIKRIYEQILQQENQDPQDPNSDDNISEGSSDKQDDKDDLSKKQLQTLFNSIKNSNKLGKNKQKKGRLNKIDLTLFQNDIQKSSNQDQKSSHDILKSFRIKQRIGHIQKTDEQVQKSEQVFIAKQGIFVATFNNPPKYFSQRKQRSSKQFGQPQSSTKITNFNFEEQKRKSDYLETISIFPNFGSKYRNTIAISQGYSPQKNNRSIVISNPCATPRSIKLQRNKDFQKTLNVFSMKNTLQRKLQQIGADKFDNSYTKFTRTNFHHHNQQKNTSITFSKRLFDRSNIFQ